MTITNLLLLCLVIGAAAQDPEFRYSSKESVEGSNGYIIGWFLVIVVGIVLFGGMIVAYFVRRAVRSQFKKDKGNPKREQRLLLELPSIEESEMKQPADIRQRRQESSPPSPRKSPLPERMAMELVEIQQVSQL
eukprot:m.338419 g.338419  ORF g.338419 m.338419 type:complete len:134 (+) comp18410_c0_seq1:114-515(+)